MGPQKTKESIFCGFWGAHNFLLLYFYIFCCNPLGAFQTHYPCSDLNFVFQIYLSAAEKINNFFNFHHALVQTLKSKKYINKRKDQKYIEMFLGITLFWPLETIKNHILIHINKQLVLQYSFLYYKIKIYRLKKLNFNVSKDCQYRKDRTPG